MGGPNLIGRAAEGHQVRFGSIFANWAAHGLVFHVEHIHLPRAKVAQDSNGDSPSIMTTPWVQCGA